MAINNTADEIRLEPTTEVPLEARSGLDPWRIGELPQAPRPKGLEWMSAVGPGVIVLGLSIGAGEFLLGPAVFVQYGLTLFWVAASCFRRSSTSSSCATRWQRASL